MHEDQKFLLSKAIELVGQRTDIKGDRWRETALTYNTLIRAFCEDGEVAPRSIGNIERSES